MQLKALFAALAVGLALAGQAAVTRQDTAGQPAGGWHKEQALTVQEAIAAYTLNPAYASHEEAIKGSITKGKLADMVVLSRDILKATPAQILETRVLYTVFGGRVVYQTNAPPKD
jgi:predicted amidohydrolase YtcJ